MPDVNRQQNIVIASDDDEQTPDSSTVYALPKRPADQTVYALPKRPADQTVYALPKRPGDHAVAPKRPAGPTVYALTKRTINHTVYALPKRSADQNVVDIVMMILNDDGPKPMLNMKPAKKTRNAVDQFYEEHQREYEARGQSTQNQIDWVHAHNNASPKLYDELQKRRSLTKVGMKSEMFLGAARELQLCDECAREFVKYNRICPKCNRRKPRVVRRRKEKKPKPCKKGKDSKNNNNTNNKKKVEEPLKKDPKIKLTKVLKRIIPKPKKQRTRYSSNSKTRPYFVSCSNKCFQCYLTAETKNVSTFKSVNDFLSVPRQDILSSTQVSRQDILPTSQSNEKNDSKSKCSYNKKRTARKVRSADSGYPETETGPSVSSYSSYMSTEHEPMVE